nr:hypothetical protein [Tanacetum cinerariifolium]
MGKTEIKDGDAYKDDLLGYKEGDEKAPYSAIIEVLKGLLYAIEELHLMGNKIRDIMILNSRLRWQWRFEPKAKSKILLHHRCSGSFRRGWL